MGCVPDFVSFTPSSNFLPFVRIVSSSLARSTCRSTGGLRAATSRPWYLRVFKPETVDEAYPPKPFVTSHSVFIPVSMFERVLWSRVILGKEVSMSDHSVF